ncbi:MAG: ComF family protein [Flavobacteriales bacterium]
MFNSLFNKYALMEGFVKPLLHLFFPFRCRSCGLELLRNESVLCLFCETALEFTSNQADLPTCLSTEAIDLHSLFYYRKDRCAQSLLHALKYEHESDACSWWGQVFAKSLKAQELEIPPYLLPVPLHPHKEFLRGYNQSACIAEGILAIYPAVTLKPDLIKRVKNSRSQTRKNRANRLNDVSNVFELNTEAWGNISHIGLVDDVITTGATLKGIIDLIKSSHPHVRITIFVLAVTK